MTIRFSCVKNLYVNSLLSSSILSIGDTSVINPETKVLAIQREVPIFYENEGDFSAYPLFSQPIEQPIVKESVEMIIINKSPKIQVENINITGVSSSSIVHIGTTECIKNESRIKNFRQLLHE